MSEINMDASFGGNHCLQYWQKLHFITQNSNPSKKADAFRSMISEVQNAKINGNMSEDCAQKMKLSLCEQLSNVIDDFNSETGLNNYADAALNLIKYQKVESHLWKCNLEFVPEAFSKFKECSKKNAEVVNDSNLENIFLRKTKQRFSEFASSLNKNIITGPTSLQFENTNNKFTTGDNKSNADEYNENSFPLFGQNNSNQRNRKRNRFQSNKDNVIENYMKCDRITDVQKNTRKFNSNEAIANSDLDLHPPQTISSFRTAKDQLLIESKNKFRANNNRPSSSTIVNPFSYGSNKKSLGSRTGTCNKFIPPVLKNDLNSDQRTKYEGNNHQTHDEDVIEDEMLKNICPKMIELIKSEIMDHGPPVTWDDIAGLEFAKSTIKEIVVWPMLRPDLFTGLRGPPKGLLLFGPPGTGKTLIGKCIATQSQSTFFNISASSLTSKWIGDGEKMVRALFSVARSQLPAVIFIDEIDSLLTQRSESEHESSRRIKTEFLVQLDGATTANDEQLLIVGATNRPQELDEAARRRLVKRLYIPLPEALARRQIVSKLLKNQVHEVKDEELEIICEITEGYSGADMTSLCKEASLGPIRSLSVEDIQKVSLDDVRPINISDFKLAAKQVRASVSSKDLDLYLKWNENFGSISAF